MNVCFNGCSFTVGKGFPKSLRDTYIYDRLVAKELQFESRTNIAEAGSSNYRIFLRSAQAIMSKQFDVVFTQWSELNRLWFHPGPDCSFFVNDGNADFKYREIYLSPKKKDEFRDTVIMLNHDYQNIIELVEYCKILDQLSVVNGVKSFYINGLLPWKQDLFSSESVPSGPLGPMLSEYTKFMLDFNHRDDAEISSFFIKLKNKVKAIDQSKWVNLCNSMAESIIDLGPEGHHPGVKSNEALAQHIVNFLKGKI